MLDHGLGEEIFKDKASFQQKRKFQIAFNVTVQFLLCVKLLNLYLILYVCFNTFDLNVTRHLTRTKCN